jgi:hypothetical protein
MNLNKLYFAQKYGEKDWIREYKRWWWVKKFDIPIDFKREFNGVWVDEFKNHTHITDSMRYAVREGKEL